jgi:hypothetical protein
MTENQITSAAQAKTFIFAGRAVFTVKSAKTGTHITFKVKRPKKDADIHFVSVLDHADGVGGYTYLGLIKDGNFRTTAKSVYHTETSAPAVTAAAWLFSQLQRGELSPRCELLHEGRCGRCGRALTDPDSIKTGIGPECVKKMQCAEV